MMLRNAECGMYSKSKVEDDKNYKRQQSAPSFRKKTINPIKTIPPPPLPLQFCCPLLKKSVDEPYMNILLRMSLNNVSQIWFTTLPPHQYFWDTQYEDNFDFVFFY